jgi:hypothetical protein
MMRMMQNPPPFPPGFPLHLSQSLMAGGMAPPMLPMMHHRGAHAGQTLKRSRDVDEHGEHGEHGERRDRTTRGGCEHACCDLIHGCIAGWSARLPHRNAVMMPCRVRRERR